MYAAYWSVERSNVQLQILVCDVVDLGAHPTHPFCSDHRGNSSNNFGGVIRRRLRETQLPRSVTIVTRKAVLQSAPALWGCRRRVQARRS